MIKTEDKKGKPGQKMGFLNRGDKNRGICIINEDTGIYIFPFFLSYYV